VAGKLIELVIDIYLSSFNYFTLLRDYEGITFAPHAHSIYSANTFSVKKYAEA
jgi:hypothetical protein